MKAILALVLLFTMNVIAQVPDAKEQPKNDPQIDAAKAFAQKFIDTAFSEDYAKAEKMMTPNPPQKEERSSSEFRKDRQAVIKRIVEERNKLGKTRSWDSVSVAKWGDRAGRPPEEQFAAFYFGCTYPNGSKSGNRVVVMKRGDQMFVETFSN